MLHVATGSEVYTYPKIGLEAEGIDDRDESAHVVKRCARDGAVLQDMSSPSRKYSVQTALGVRGADHTARVYRLHQPRARH